MYATKISGQSRDVYKFPLDPYKSGRRKTRARRGRKSHRITRRR